MMSSSPRSRLSRTKRACDGCQIRKVKCDGGQPCLSCANTQIACTFSRTVHTRGPRRMRESTRCTIERIQRGERQQSIVADGIIDWDGKHTSHSVEVTPTSQRTWNRIPLDTLVPQLYIYHLRMFPVWPVVNIDDLIAELQHGDEDSHDHLEAYALATSVVAATVAQLRLDQKGGNTSTIQAIDLVNECERACNIIRYKSRLNTNTIRILFFLHIYHENQQPGCAESLLCLRESISIAQLMSLHQERAYISRDVKDQNLRRWILWLLFVTERGVCLLHKMPVIIKTNIALPTISCHNGQSVLPAFIQLINLFWTFEQAGLFDVVGDCDSIDSSSAVQANAILDSLTVESLHRKLHEVAKDFVSIPDVQKVDIYVTRHWMKMILWKLRSPSSASSNDMSVAFPLSAASGFLNTVTRLPASAFEAHGLTIQLKIVEIASSVVDCISHLAALPVALPNWTNDLSPGRILTHLDSLMCSFRHKAAKSLIDLLCQKTAEVHARTGHCSPLSNRSLLGSLSNYGHAALDEGRAESTDRRQNLLTLPNFDDALSALEPDLLLSSANDVSHDYADQYQDDMPSVQMNSPGELSSAMFSQHIGQNIMCSSQHMTNSALSLDSTLPVGSSQSSFSTLVPFTPSHYESTNESPEETALLT